MAYFDFDFVSHRKTNHNNNSNIVKHWDYAFSCYEPLDNVTGGIGTYIKHLLQLLTQDERNKTKKIALFCRKKPSTSVLEKLTGVDIFEIKPDWTIYGKAGERLGNEHDWFSWDLAHNLVKLTSEGHVFDFFEFPDYAVEGYFPIKMRRAGLISINTIAIRLHSPELMLFRDNQLPGRAYDCNRLTRISRELFCYRNCDQILYGAPEMLHRVSEECQRFGLDINNKVIQIEHPYPVGKSNTDIINFTNEKNYISVGYVGRLEIRKGILAFFELLLKNSNLLEIVKKNNILFELFGADLPDHQGVSVKSQLIQLSQEAGLEKNLIIHGYTPQNELQDKMKHIKGFIFPSIFENYPNALLEVLHRNVPVLISKSGGMPYLCQGLSGIFTFSYKKKEYQEIELFFKSLNIRVERSSSYFDKMNKINQSIQVSYNHLLSHNKICYLDWPPEITNDKLSVDFVIPFFNDSQYIKECLLSIKKIMNNNDNIYIVDDCSVLNENLKLKSIVKELFGNNKNINVYTMEINSGPSAARNFGVKMGSGDLIQFIDSDDTINTTGYFVSRKYLIKNNDVDFIYGLQDNFGAVNHIWTPRDSSAMTCLDDNYTHSAILIKRTIFENSGGYDEAMRYHFEDWQFYCKLALTGCRGEVIPFVTQHYRVRKNSRTYQNSEKESFSREKVLHQTCLYRNATDNLLQGELLELIGKYSSQINFYGIKPIPEGSSFKRKFKKLRKKPLQFFKDIKFFKSS